jgi:mannose-6-phosphate isomerase-like protein (cupin superfamily)
MSEFHGNLEHLTIKNTHYRKVVGTTKNMQLVLMCLQPKEEIGMEIHPETSQFFRIESGRCLALVGDERIKLYEDDALIVPPNTKHNLINRSSKKMLKMYTIYTPPQHAEICDQEKKTEKEC